MSKWIERFKKIVDFELTVSPLISDIHIYMDGEEYQDFKKEMKQLTTVGECVINSAEWCTIDVFRYMGACFYIKNIDSI